MANQSHIDILKRGTAGWNSWRQQSPRAVPDFEGLDLTLITSDLSCIDFHNTNLSNAKLNGIKLIKANLYDAKFSSAHLVDVDVSGADLRGADFSAAIVDGIKYDKTMKCLGARIDTATGSQRFKRAVIESDYIEAFTFEHPAISQIWSLTSNYSRSPLRIALIGLIVIGIFAAIYYIFPHLVHWPSTVVNQSQSLTLKFAPIYYSIVTFTTLGYGDVYPVTTVGELLASGEVLIGYVWLGYLVSVLASRAVARA